MPYSYTNIARDVFFRRKKEHKRNSTDYKITAGGSREARVAGGWEGAALGTALSRSRLYSGTLTRAIRSPRSCCGRAAKPRCWPAQQTLPGDRARPRGLGLLVGVLVGLEQHRASLPGGSSCQEPRPSRAAWSQGSSHVPGQAGGSSQPARGISPTSR